jgi:hypothetical protein
MLVSEIVSSEISVGKYNFPRKQAAYLKDPKSNKLSCDSFKIAKKTAVIQFTAHLSSDQILVSEYGLSLPVTIENQDDLEKIQAFTEFIPNYLLEQKDTESWETSELVKDDDKIFLKLKFNKSKQATFKSNLPINMKKPGDTRIHSDQKVEITATVKFYFNFEDEKAGVNLAVSNLNFEIDEDDIETPPTKRVKTE